MDKPRLVLRRGLKPPPERLVEVSTTRRTGVFTHDEPGVDAGDGYIYVYRFENLLVGTLFTLLGSRTLCRKISVRDYVYHGSGRERLITEDYLVCVPWIEHNRQALYGIPLQGTVLSTGSAVRAHSPPV